MSVILRWRRAEDGVAAVEGAIVLFAFVFLIFSIMEFLYVLFAYNSVVRGAENAARSAMVNSWRPNVCSGAWQTAYVNNGAANVGVIPVTISVNGCVVPTAAAPPVQCSTSGAAQAGTIVIHAEYDFQASGFFISYLSSTLPIQATVCVPLIS